MPCFTTTSNCQGTSTTMRKVLLDDAGDKGDSSPLLDNNEKGMSMDWQGRPADDRLDLGGWTCSLCTLGSLGKEDPLSLTRINSIGSVGAFGLVFSAYFGIAGNLVIYLVQVWGEANAVAANRVTNLIGTTFLCSFIGAFTSDAYMGRLWGSVAFEILSVLSFVLSSLAGLLLSRDSSSSSTAAARAFFLVSVYMMALATGSTFPNLTSLGADQLSSNEDKGKYFTLVAMVIGAAQIVATTVVTYLDNGGNWVWGFWLCTAEAGTALMMSLAVARGCRQYRAAGNPFLRIIQVLVAALRKRSLIPPEDSSLLHEANGELSAIPGCRKLQHTNSLGFLDKAAALSATEQTNHHQTSAWRLCTVTQVEEVKCLLRVIPVGIASTCIAAISAQINTLFEEQAVAMNTQVATWLVIPPASIHLFSIGGTILTGIVNNAGGARFLGWCLSGRKGHGTHIATSLQIQGVAIVVGIVAMVIAALVEAHRLNVAHGGALLSVLWLIPQTFLLGVSSNLVYAGSLNFFYNEVSDGMRTVSTSISLLFLGGGNYLSSIFITLVTDITAQGGHSGWIPSDLNDGHVDYFYWFLASVLTFMFGLYLVYAHFYTYRDTYMGDNLEP